MFPHLGGFGGGKLHISVKEFLTVDGTISANGGRFKSQLAGGGSGGSILIHTHTIDGDGSLQVHGGDGDGGGGAGGRMALYYIQNYFVGKCILQVH